MNRHNKRANPRAA